MFNYLIRDFLDSHKVKTVPTDFLVKLMEKVLSTNIFEFNNKLYRQTHGTAMGTPAAVSYANVGGGPPLSFAPIH